MNWDLTLLFKTESDYENAVNELSTFAEKFGKYKGKLNNEKAFVEYVKLSDDFELLGGRVYQYASLKSDLNKKNIENSAKLSKVFSIFNDVSVATSFEAPELLSIGKEKVFAIIDKNPEIEAHRFVIEKLFRNSEHILDSESEKLISYYANVSRTGVNMYTALANSDRIGVKKVIDGKEVTISPSNFVSLLENSKTAEERKEIFEAVYKHFDENKNTFGEIYNSILESNKARSKARKYDNILSSFLFNNNIPNSVYYNLVDVASNNVDSLKKYIEIRKKYLGLEKYHTYDRFMNLAVSDSKYSYEDAKRIFFESIDHLPEDFKNYAREALRDGYVDVLPHDGKRTGAYSSGVTDTHPFILLNYTESLDDVFTVAHEAGHSIHSLYAMNSQPGPIQDYTIFVAEIASTFNEHMLLDYFIKSKDSSKEVKIQLLQKSIDSIISTFYRQTLFAHYELIAHNLIEKNEAINYEVLSNIMIDLYKKYYGIDINDEVYKKYVWAYIPHLFNSPFYVYQYATSFAASFKIYQDVVKGVPLAFEKYINLLKSGGSKYPIDQAAEAGVDFTNKETFRAVIDRMDQLVSELEKLLKE